MRHLIPVLFFLSLAACTHEVQKPQHHYKVTVTTDSEKKIWVTRADGSRQCDQNGVPGPDQVAKQVQGAGILVFHSRTGNDGQMHAQRCGAPTGRTVDLEISQVDIRKALALGFVTKEDAAAPSADDAQ